jgi:3-methylcrotonyl-CoA carboxylase alpha subunit
MFKKILIANRGEIACRVAATCRRLGIRSVAVFSDADANAKHVAWCDEAVHIGGAAAADSYLQAARIVEAAVAVGAEAIHPGYGFLSENEAFAEACAAHGIAFIGPPVAAIAAMGSKAAAKALMQDAAVPLVPGYHGDDQDPAHLQREADAIGYPVLLKASAGGGGKGMRVVERSADFAAALASCKREAAASFGNDRVLIEKYLTRPRHVEVQVFADQAGNTVYLFDRDCSVQRRHQKVLEEAPAPGLSAAVRTQMGQAAVAAARAVGYVGAGTVEFIMAPGGAFYFMEMNTRLQVEHPVTEMVTGLDLVEWQLRVAAGEPLPLMQDALRIEGHAIEARIYAENPVRGFLPSTGTLKHMRTPDAVEFAVGSASGTRAAVRIDSGVREGDSITPFYDPMIAKLIVYGADRDAALARLASALAEFEIVGPSTNVEFLQRIAGSVPFTTADLDTGLIERHHDALFAQPATTAQAVRDALALACAAQLAEDESCARGMTPWSALQHWRLNAGYRRVLSWRLNTEGGGEGSAGHQANEAALDAVFEHDGREATLELAGTRHRFAWRCGSDRHEYSISVDTTRVAGRVFVDGDRFHVFCRGTAYVFERDNALAHAAEEQGGGRLTAPMPGKVIAVLVETGVKVEKGAPLLVMEAMKMEHTIAAPAAGTVTEILYAVGDQVSDGAQLLVLEAGG